MIKKTYMIMDMQFGSTGKGLLAGYLAEKLMPDTIVTAWMPNAGHTYIDRQGRKYVHTMLANGVVSPRAKNILLGAGSAINLDNLGKEITSCLDHIRSKRINIIIHPNAAIVTQMHRDDEARLIKIGSTMKGGAEAVIEKMRRGDASAIASGSKHVGGWVKEMNDKIGRQAVMVDRGAYDLAVDMAEVIQIEGAQGYSLSINGAFYPKCTSRDVSPAQVMADCCLPLSLDPEVYGTVRTYPIRVSNRMDKHGNIVGYSGGCYDDQREINWDEIANPPTMPEKTTVTKLPRRVFTYSEQQVEDAIRAFAPKKVFVNFLNYASKRENKDIVDHINSLGTEVAWVSDGATAGDIMDLDLITYSDKSIKDLVVDWADMVFPDRTIENAIRKLVLEEIPEFLVAQDDPMELADVAILVVDIAHLAGIDLDSAVRRKMAINKGRKWALNPKTGLLGHVGHVGHEEEEGD